jgi:hypothetical protein
MAPFLHPCESCARHIRAGEAACPFCGAAVTQVAAPARGSVARPMSRAALLFMGATTSIACGSSSTNPPTTEPDAAIQDSGVDAAIQDSGVDTGEPAAMYGPAMIDSGSEFDAAGVVLYGPGVVEFDAGKK